MTDAQKIAVKKFLLSVKGAVMAMDVETLKDDQLTVVFNDFVALMDAATPEDENSSSTSSASSDDHDNVLD